MIKLFFISFLSFISLGLSAGNSDKISNALQTGNSASLSEMFNSSIELITPSVTGVYSKEQAKLVIENFFKLNSPTKCTLSHETNGASSVMLVFELTTKNGQFRVSVVGSNTGGVFVINEFKIQ